MKVVDNLGNHVQTRLLFERLHGYLQSALLHLGFEALTRIETAENAQRSRALTPTESAAKAMKNHMIVKMNLKKIAVKRK